MITPNMGFTVINDGESPFYTTDSPMPPNVSTPPDNSMPYTDVNTVLGLAAKSQIINANVVAIAGGTGGVIPPVSIPGSATAGTSKVVSYMSGTLAFLKANPPTGIALAVATDVGPVGALYLYLDNPAFGDSGWILLAGG